MKCDDGDAKNDSLALGTKATKNVAGAGAELVGLLALGSQQLPKNFQPSLSHSPSLKIFIYGQL